MKKKERKANNKLELIIRKIKTRDQKLDLKILDARIAEIDNELFDNRPIYLIVKEFSIRHVRIPEEGKIKIKRRRYFNKRTKKYVYLLDEKLKLTKRKKIFGDVKR